MSASRIDISTVRVGHVLRFEFTAQADEGGSLTLSLSVVHVDIDGRTVRTFARIEQDFPKEDADYRILAMILDTLPRIDARTLDGSRLFAHEVRRNGSLVQVADSVQKIWESPKNRWEQAEYDLRAIRGLTSVSFIAR